MTFCFFETNTTENKQTDWQKYLLHYMQI